MTPNDQKAPFHSVLQDLLTPGQEDLMVQHFLQRVDETENEMGRAVDGRTFNRTSFLGRRKAFEDHYYNRTDYRALGEDGRPTLFGKSPETNQTLNVSRRYARQMTARAQNYFFGTSPWFAAIPRGLDQTEAELVRKYVAMRVDVSGMRAPLNNAIEFMMARGEWILKTTYQEDLQQWRDKCVVLIDPETDQPYKTPVKQAYVYAADTWIQAPSEDAGAAPQLVLQKDPSFAMPGPAESLRYEERVVVKLIKRRSGPETIGVYPNDMLIPLNAPCEQSADMIAHLYDMTLSDLVNKYHRDDFYRLYAQQLDEKEVLRMMQQSSKMFQELFNTAEMPRSSQDQPRDNRMEDVGYFYGPLTRRVINLAECWGRFDADGDGVAEEVMIVIDRVARKAVFYDYLGNVTDSCQRPFRVVRPCPVAGRWYGIGAMEMFEKSQHFIDLTVNRINFRNGGSGRVTFWNPGNTVEGENNPHLKLNDGGTYRLKSGAQVGDTLAYVQLPNLTDGLQSLLELFMQQVELESGFGAAGGGSANGLNQSDTATGNRLLDKTGQELFAMILNSIEVGLTHVLRDHVRMELRYFDQEAAGKVLDPAEVQQLLLSADQIRELDLSISLLMTRQKTEQELASAMEGITLLIRYYALPFEQQGAMIDILHQALKALQFNNAEKIQPIASAAPPTDASASAHIDPVKLINALASLLKSGADLSSPQLQTALSNAGLPPSQSEVVAAPSAG